jgi:hypothetical protein
MTSDHPSPADGGIGAGALVPTLRGLVPVETLVPGDRVVTRRGAVTLRALRVRGGGPARLVRIAPGTLGHDRPGAPLWLAADQPMILRDWRARALFGVPVARVPAARLADGEWLALVTVASARLWMPVFDTPQAIWADGVELGAEAVPVAV